MSTSHDAPSSLAKKIHVTRKKQTHVTAFAQHMELKPDWKQRLEIVFMPFSFITRCIPQSHFHRHLAFVYVFYAFCFFFQLDLCFEFGLRKSGVIIMCVSYKICVHRTLMSPLRGSVQRGSAPICTESVRF